MFLVDSVMSSLDLCVEIMCFLTLPDIIAVHVINKEMRSILQANNLWMALFGKIIMLSDSTVQLDPAVEWRGEFLRLCRMLPRHRNSRVGVTTDDDTNPDPDVINDIKFSSCGNLIACASIRYCTLYRHTDGFTSRELLEPGLHTSKIEWYTHTTHTQRIHNTYTTHTYIYIV